MPSALWIQGISDEDLDIAVMRAGNPWSPAPVERPYEPMQGMIGGVIAPTALGQPRVTPVSVHIRGGRTVSTRRAALDAMLSRVQGRMVEVEWADEPGTYRRCIVDRVPVEALNERVSFVEDLGRLVATLELFEPVPARFANHPEVLGFGSTPTPARLGRLPSVPRFFLPGPFTAAEIVYRGITGDPLAGLGITHNVADGEYVEVDCGRYGQGVVVYFDGTDRHVDLSLLTSGGFFTLDPSDGVFAGGHWPTLEVSGAAQAYAHYRRAW